ncbi:hypothetical protein C8Q72DRAFT_799122 [Fomitopsis betulina]|nr:hypothetical protein C8Q72DRAFT_799122 [Fomitopsis betulina]
MSKSSTCSCRMSIVNARTGRHLLLQGRVYPAPETPDNCLTLPSIRFGRCGLALDHFDKEDNAERSLPRALKKPLERYSSEGLTHITVQVTWPSHGRDRAPFGVEIAVKDRRGEALTMAELWRKASSAITDVMKHVAQDDSQEECCWAVSTGAGPGLRRCCVYLVELVHLGGVTYQPELHIAQSVRQQLSQSYPAPAPAPAAPRCFSAFTIGRDVSFSVIL